MIEPAGIYVHLPYCAVRCGYCTFFVETDDSSRAAYLGSLEAEAAGVAESAQGAAFDSIYLGGGTPSRIPAADIARLLRAMRARFAVAQGAEVTLEANPEDVEAHTLGAWQEAGVTRVSLGVQSFADAELAAVGRAHDARAALRALAILSDARVSLNADLILGLPEQTPETFLASLRRLLDHPVDHVSVYLLEDSREVAEDRRGRPERYLGDDAQAALWLSAGRLLAERGFDHYEVSNWALPGRQARHNRKYWDRVETVGLGASAHELWGGLRRANVSSLPRYVSELASGRRPTVFERRIDDEESEREAIILGMRKAEGVPSEAVSDYIARQADARLAGDWRAWTEAGLVAERNGRSALTELGFLVSNEILCRFV